MKRNREKKVGLGRCWVVCSSPVLCALHFIIISRLVQATHCSCCCLLSLRQRTFQWQTNFIMTTKLLNYPNVSAMKWRRKFSVNAMKNWIKQCMRHISRFPIHSAATFSFCFLFRFRSLWLLCSLFDENEWKKTLQQCGILLSCRCLWPPTSTASIRCCGCWSFSSLYFVFHFKKCMKFERHSIEMMESTFQLYRFSSEMHLKYSLWFI